MNNVTLCGECETTLLDILETVEFDVDKGCWVETSRTPLFSVCRIYLAYLCGTYDADPDADFSKLHTCEHFRFGEHECCNPEHLRPKAFYEED